MWGDGGPDSVKEMAGLQRGGQPSRERTSNLQTVKPKILGWHWNGRFVNMIWHLLHWADIVRCRIPDEMTAHETMSTWHAWKLWGSLGQPKGLALHCGKWQNNHDADNCLNSVLSGKCWHLQFGATTKLRRNWKYPMVFSGIVFAYLEQLLLEH